MSYFDVGFILCDSGTRDAPRPKIECADHGCAGFFEGTKATIFDGASWLEKSDAVKEALETYFDDAGFELTIINKHYQQVYGNCAMFAAVCVFLMLIYGQAARPPRRRWDAFFDKMEQLTTTEKNRLIETIAVRIRRFVTRPESFLAQPALRK